MEQELIEGLFGYKIPLDGSASSSVRKKRKAWETAAESNPMVRAYGQHPDPDMRCKSCAHLFYRQFAKRYYKCDLRGCTGGPATDHRKHWPACNKFILSNEKKQKA